MAAEAWGKFSPLAGWGGMRVTARFLVFPQNEASENSSETGFFGEGREIEQELSSEMLCDSAKQAEKKKEKKLMSLKILHPRPCL